MRINLFDPRHESLGGHNVEWNLLIAKDLIRRGHEVQLFCSANASNEARHAFSKFGSVTPMFLADPYAQPQGKTHELSLFIDVANRMAHRLSQLEPADLWLWPTLFPPQLLSCVLANPGITVSGCIHSEPSSPMPNGKIWWQYAFEKAIQTGLSLNLSTTTPGLQKIYSGIAPRMAIKCAPIAQDGLPASSPKTRMKTIGFFGMQRSEKGMYLLHALITKLLGAGYEVILQDSNGRINIENTPNLTTLGYIDNFAQEITRCDLVVIPYNPAPYRYRLSAVAAEAIASGVPVIVPAGTSMGNMVQETGAGKSFSAYNAEIIFQSISAAETDYANVAYAAFRVSQEWLSKHGSKRFVSHLLDGSDQ